MDLCTVTELCETCLNILLTSNSLKQSCIHNENKIILYKSVQKKNLVDLQNVLLFHGQEDAQMYDFICRLCFKYLYEGEGSKLINSPYTLIVKKCLPDLDLNVSLKPLICKHCVSLVEKIYNFLETCLTIQGILEKYMEKNNTDELNSEDLLYISNLQLEKMKIDNNILGKNIKKEEPNKDKNDKFSLGLEVLNYDEVKAEIFKIDGCADKNSHNNDNNNNQKNNNRTEIKLKKTKSTTVNSKDVQENVLICALCKRKFKSRQGFTKHVKNHNNNDNTKNIFKCEICDFETVHKGNLRKHLEVIHAKKEKCYRCNKCEYETSSQDYLRDHMNVTHNFSKTTKIHKCTFCAYTSAKKSNFNRHLMSIHNKPTDDNFKSKELYKCPYCSCQTSVKSYFKKHMRLKHQEEETETYLCVLCNYQTKDKSYLAKHMFKKHNRRLKCDYCTFETRSKVALRYHVLGNHRKGTDDWLKCDDCEYRAPRRESYYNHVKYAHKKASDLTGTCNFRCAMCNFETVRKGSLVTHIKWSHPKEYDMELYKCDKCSFQTYRKRYHSRHLAECFV